jgi:CelD/BcsL family acetyltransferase involved in cellulose biosynthesis
MHSHDSLDSDSISYQVVTRLSDIHSISSDWDSLLERSPCNRAFSSSSWFLAACRHVPLMSPYVILARRGETLVGVLPLALTHDGEIAGFPGRFSDYNDLVALPEESHVLAGLLNYAISGSKSYKRVVLSNIRRDSNCMRAVQVLRLTGHRGGPISQDRICRYIRLSSGYEEYLATRGRRFRKTLRYAHRQATSNNVEVRQLEVEHFPWDQLPDVFLSLHLSRMGVKSCFASAEGESFAREMLPKLFAERRMQVFALFEQEKPIGIDLCMVGVNSLCAWNGGFSPEAEHWSPGRLLIDTEIKQAYAMQLEEYDFMRGEEDYKFGWATHSRVISQLELEVQS